jgi:hypothetical protein
MTSNIKSSSQYEKIGNEIGKLVASKQLAYGKSFQKSGECLRQMFPNGIRPDQYDELLAIARILDKLFRIAHDPHAFGENPWKDAGGYCILGAEMFIEKSQKRDENEHEDKL